MPKAANEILVDRPAADVFEFLADAENDVKWRNGVLDIKRLSGNGVGTTYAQGVKGPGGRRIAADVEITKFEPNKLIGFRAIKGPVRPTGSYQLTPVDGVTLVRFELEAQLRGLKKLMTPMVQKTMTSEVAALEKLKRILESP